jgi:putative membrane protein
MFTTAESQARIPFSRNRLLQVLGLVYLAIWVLLSLGPRTRFGWLLESLPLFLMVPLLVWVHRKGPLSDLSWICFGGVAVLHMVGAHHTYAEVPFGHWLQGLFGLQRNPYDRLVHFTFGFAIAYPMREILLQAIPTRGFWTYWLPFNGILAAGAAYEIVEWAVAVRVPPPVAQSYVAVQWDVWDAQKDMLMAALGAALSLGFLAWHHRRADRMG